MVTTKDQDFEVNNTDATYKQDDDLTKEMTLSVSINYEKKFYKFGKILISIDGMQTTQDVSSIGANISFIKILCGLSQRIEQFLLVKTWPLVFTFPFC